MYRKIYSHANSIRVLMIICDDHTYIPLGRINASGIE